MSSMTYEPVTYRCAESRDAMAYEEYHAMLMLAVAEPSDDQVRELVRA